MISRLNWWFDDGFKLYFLKPVLFLIKEFDPVHTASNLSWLIWIGLYLIKQSKAALPEPTFIRPPAL